jgi:D-arabinose 1-dehydrogenase-like Zn-dependent alcohol dehydrogenase
MKGRTTVLTGFEQLEQREYDVPEPGAGEMVAEMLRANICGSELHIWRGHHPLIVDGCVPGHEGIGRALRLGAGVDRDFAGQPLREGDRIVATYFQMCRRCPACQRGEWNLCQNAYAFWRQPATADPHFHGTFGTHYYIHRDQYVYRVPDNVSDRAASGANCALSQMAFGVHISELGAGETLLIQGAGGLGLCGIAIAKERGAKVVVTEVSQDRIAAARRFGADEVVDLSGVDSAEDRVTAVHEAAGGAPDVVIDVTGVPSTFPDGVRTVRSGGRFVSIGSISPGKLCEFDPGLFTRSGVTIRSAIRYHPWFLGRALQFVSEHPEYPWEQLVDADYTLDDVEQGLRDSADRKIARASIKVSADAS